LTGFERISLSLLDSGSYGLLSEKILGVLKSKEIVPKDDVLIVSIRHAESLARARSYLEEAIQSLGIVPLEFTANNLRSSMNELSEILGRFDNEKILDKVFSSFCIGK
jgi:tRNA modification GTPase